jgi:hypothetical protein
VRDWSSDVCSSDLSGNMLTDIQEDWYNNAWVNPGKDTYTYDNNGNCIHGEYSLWQNGVWVPFKGILQIRYKHYPGEIYSFNYTFIDIEYTSITGVVSEKLNVSSFNLQQNYPNPFNPSTVISYSLPSASNVKLIAYNSLGQTVKVLEAGFKQAGNHSITFNATDFPSGIYFYRIEAGQFMQIKKMILIK